MLAVSNLNTQKKSSRPTDLEDWDTIRPHPITSQGLTWCVTGWKPIVNKVTYLWFYVVRGRWRKPAAPAVRLSNIDCVNTALSLIVGHTRKNEQTIKMKAIIDNRRH